MLSHNSPKRPLSETSSQNTQKVAPEEEATDSSLMDVEDSTDEMISSLPSARKLTKKKTKLRKIEEPDAITVEEMIAPLKELLEGNPSNYVLNYNQFKSLIENAKGNPNVTELALTYTTDIQALSDMIKQMYPHLTDRKIKNRCTRMTKKFDDYIATKKKESLTCSNNLSTQDTSKPFFPPLN